MQHVPLTVEMVLRRARRARSVVTATPDGDTVLSWAEVADRAARLRAALPALGVKPGDRVATFARNTHRHVELILGVPAAGAVVHPLNIRLFRDQLEYIVGEAEDMSCSWTRTRRGGEGARRPHDHPRRVRGAARRRRAGRRTGDSAGGRRPRPLLHERDDRRAEGRGLLAPVDRPARARAPDGRLARVSRDDVLMPVTGLFHVLGWGLPYAVALAGGDLVLPGHSNDAARSRAPGRRVQGHQGRRGADRVERLLPAARRARPSVAARAADRRRARAARADRAAMRRTA